MDKVIIWLLLYYLLFLETSLASLSIQISIFFGTYDNPFCLCLLVFAEQYTSKPKYRHSRVFIVILRSRHLHGVLTKLLLENALAIRPCNCGAASEPLLCKVARCIPVLSSRYIGKWKVRRPCFEAL